MKSFVVVKQQPGHTRISFEDLFKDGDMEYFEENEDTVSGTITYLTDSRELQDRCGRNWGTLRQFVDSLPEKYTRQIEKDAYNSFFIPKRSGGLREISQPKEELADYQQELRDILVHLFGAKEMYHTNAYAYIDHRSTVDCVRKHSINNSRWFLKCDLSNFFGSTTPEFLFDMITRVFPFSTAREDEGRRKVLEKALNIAFMNGGLPQGTVLSPLLTNIMMIPVDYEISKTLRSYDNNRYVYTRYADDFYVSCRYDFDWKDIMSLMGDVLKKYNSPFTFKPEKTRYGSNAGQNWMLGVMLNKDNNITIGHRKKKQLSQMVFNYGMDRKNGKEWELHDIQTLLGQIGWLKQVEGKEKADGFVAFISQKVGIDISERIREDLKP